MESRVIGRYEGDEAGPLLICIGGMHGNEPAGVQAIKEIFQLLEQEPQSNPGFHYRGNVVGIQGNISAQSQGKRFISRDLNRMLISEEIDALRSLDASLLKDEERESIELVNIIHDTIQKYDPDFTLILDFHTTTADGGIFTICANDAKSRALALGLHAPVILGIAEGLQGTTIEYFNAPANNCFCIVFEAGTHDDPGSIHRSIAAIVNCMRSIGSVAPGDVDHRHDGLLISMSEGLPKMTRLVYHYKIDPEEKFEMKSGYRNFQPVGKGEVLAVNETGNIQAPIDGLILMPKYQPLGEDGFFIVERVI
jgi:succinylglutamate desuccinylase